MSSEICLALPDPLTPATHVRGAVIVNSQIEARMRGLEESYWGHVGARDAAALREIVAQSWVPMAVAVSHYRAMDALGLSHQDIIQIGRAVGDRFQKGFLGTLVRSLRASGAVSPRSLLPRLDRIVGRGVRGGGVAARMVGPKDAEIVHRAIAIAAIPYVRIGWLGMYQAGAELTAKTVYTHELPPPDAESAAFRLSWV